MEKVAAFAGEGEEAFVSAIGAVESEVTCGKRDLETITRFDMPDFKPRPAYIREMKRYGILPADLPPDATIDPYQTDRRYWQSLWHHPPGANR